MTAARRRCATLLLVVVAAGCAARGKASAPDSVASGRLDDLATAEAELARNAADLQALGIVVAQRGPRPQGEPGRTDADDREKNLKKTEPGSPPEPDAQAPEPITPEPGGEPTRPTGGGEELRAVDSAQTPCQRICTLAGVACDLSQRICTLAAQHEGNARYEDVCWNAERQCEQASDACSDCSAC